MYVSEQMGGNIVDLRECGHVVSCFQIGVILSGSLKTNLHVCYMTRDVDFPRVVSVQRTLQFLEQLQRFNNGMS